jgi:hypothetical protein
VSLAFGVSKSRVSDIFLQHLSRPRPDSRRYHISGASTDKSKERLIHIGPEIPGLEQSLTSIKPFPVLLLYSWVVRRTRTDVELSASPHLMAGP